MALPALGANLPDLFRRLLREDGDAPLFWAKRDGRFQPWSRRRVEEESRAVAAFLQEAGVKPGDRVVLVSENRPEWGIADLAIMRAGGITVPAYTTNTAADHAYLLNHSEARAVICSTKRLAGPLLQAVAEAPAVETALFLEPPAGAVPDRLRAARWDEVVAAPRPLACDHTERLSADDLACFIYTSGTGGRPKGVMLTHGNILANIGGAIRLLERVGLEREVFLSFLPLSHAYEHTAGLWFPIAIGGEIYYAESLEQLSANLLEARPTILTCVPRLFEVLRQRILQQVRRQGGLRARLFHLALALGRRRLEQGRLAAHLALVDRMLERLVRSRVRARFGGRIKALVSGGAPLSPEVGRFFLALGLPVLQGYGQTEASPVITCNPPGACKIDTVGPPLEGVELRIAEDGEILVRGPNVMKGYWKDETATLQALRDGWLHTGDVGEIDAQGYLRITDRKKDIIVNSGGDNISPLRVEAALTFEPEIAQAVVYGDRRPYLVALIVPDLEFAKGFAATNGVGADLARLVDHAGFRSALAAAVERANRHLSPIERVRRFDLLSEPLTIENGFVTPTLKIKRQLVVERFRDRFERLYQPARAE